MTPWRAITSRARQPRRKRGPLFTCGTCHKGYNSPFGHTCSQGGDFAARRRRETASQRRARETAARRARRQREDDARKARRAKENEAARARKRKAAARPARPAHEYQRCRDEDCQRIGCVAYRDGLEVGDERGHARGFDEDIAACPRSHTASAS